MSNGRKEPFPNPDRKRLFMTLLKVMGGYEVEVSFSGGGDSGSIEGASLFGSDKQEINLEGAEFEWETEKAEFDQDTQKWTKTREVKVMSVSDILVQICEDCLDHTDLDWYNNEGGQGTLNINLSKEPPEITLSVGINYTHTEDHNFDFSEDGEEEEGEPTQYADLTAEDKSREELLSLLKGGDNASTSS